MGRFLRKFEEKNLAFLCQDNVRSGEPTRFFKFVRRDSDTRRTH